MLKLLSKYLTTSTIATVIDWIIFYILNTYAGVLYLLSYIISFGTGFFIKFILNKEYTFVVKQYNISTFGKYCLVNIGTFVLGAILMWVLVDILNIQGTISRIISTGVVFVYNFIMDKNYTFKVDINDKD